jgi:hypothetical protein
MSSATPSSGAVAFGSGVLRIVVENQFGFLPFPQVPAVRVDVEGNEAASRDVVDYVR